MCALNRAYGTKIEKNKNIKITTLLLDLIIYAPERAPHKMLSPIARAVPW